MTYYVDSGGLYVVMLYIYYCCITYCINMLVADTSMNYFNVHVGTKMT